MKNIVSKNLEKIRTEILPYTPAIIAVTKYVDWQNILAAYDAGLRDFAESRVMDAAKKFDRLPNNVRADSRFHFIGHLQTNKIKKAVAIFDLIHSVDSLRLSKAISNEAQKLGKIQKILLQINNANEPQKFGFSELEIFSQFSEINSLPGIQLIGLMNMAPAVCTESELMELFTDLVKIKTQLETTHKVKLPELSMGMSNDYIQASRCGATMLRIGTKLFCKD